MLGEADRDLKLLAADDTTVERPGSIENPMDQGVVLFGDPPGELAADEVGGEIGGDPTRFSRSRSVGAHLGLTPKQYQSGEIDRSRQASGPAPPIRVPKAAPCRKA